MTRLIAFDMDGTIFKGQNFWMDVHKELGTVPEAIELWERFGRRDYGEVVRRTTDLWQGRDGKPYFDIIAERDYVGGIRELVQDLKSEGYTLALISSGPYHLAERAQQELGFDIVRANKLDFDDGNRFAGTIDLQVDDNRKAAALRDIQRELGISPADTVVIGDTGSDAKMGARAAMSIGYNVRKEEDRAAFTSLVDGDSIAPAAQIILPQAAPRNDNPMPETRPTLAA